MHADVCKMIYGNYKFTAEVDTGSETGGKLLTVWFAEKVDVEHVHFSQFSVDLLLSALQDPMRSRLCSQLEQEKIACQRAFEVQLVSLQRPFVASKKLPSKVERQIRQVRLQMNSAVRRLEAEFIKRELMPLDRHSFDFDILQVASHVFGEVRFLRDFYFEEANKQHIQDFCQKFALDEAYRQDVLTGKTHWAKRDALFMRNLLPVTGEEILFAKDSSYDCKAREFFHWLDAHCEEILALPEYQWLQEIDGVPAPSVEELDPEIKQAVDLFNFVPGVTIQFSCQGVSGKVHFQGYDLLTVSPHREYGFVSFSELGPYAHDAIVALLPSYPHITTDPIPHNFALQLVLRSTGDNLTFCKELLEVARHVVADWEVFVHSAWTAHNKASVLNRRVVEGLGEGYYSPPQARHISRWQDTIYPEYCPRTSAPGGIIPSRLDWLCQSMQIERTFHVLFHLNHWTKAREHLLYADRQGLYKVKAVVLQQAYKVGAVSPIAYVDGMETFACNYSFDVAIDIAAEVFIDRLGMSFGGDNNSMDELDVEAHRIFAHIMGYEAKTQADCEALGEEQAKRFISQSLRKLVEQARSTRQPILSQELAALFISPTDLLEVHLSRDRHFPNWDELEEDETRQLDPEGLSLIAFQYDSSTAHYVFHLPFRFAEKFLPAQLLRELQSHVNASREVGTFYGRSITEAESYKYPITDLLHELLVDISAICPHGLVRKEQYLRSSRASSTPDWSDIIDDFEDDGAVWYEDC